MGKDVNDALAGTRERRTSFSNSNDVPVLETYGNGLPLDWGRLFVANLVYDLQYLLRNL
jgi:hypothetical protein